MNENDRQKQRKAAQHSAHPETKKPGLKDEQGSLPTKQSRGDEADARTHHDPDANEEQQRTRSP